MTEEEWLRCTEPRPMLEFLRASTSDRRLRLAACAFCRRVFSPLTERVCWSVIEAAEQYVDGTLDKPAYLRIVVNFDGIRRGRFPKTALEREDDVWNAAYCAVHRRWESEHDDYYAQERWQLAAAVARDAASFAGEDEGRVQVGVICDIFGNPYRPVVFDPKWRSETAVGIARGIYDDRAFERLPILADALQDAGCDNEDILTHCREPGVHVRGCWVVDLVLGKE